MRKNVNVTSKSRGNTRLSVSIERDLVAKNRGFGLYAAKWLGLKLNFPVSTVRISEVDSEFLKNNIYGNIKEAKKLKRISQKFLKNQVQTFDQKMSTGSRRINRLVKGLPVRGQRSRSNARSSRVNNNKNKLMGRV